VAPVVRCRTSLVATHQGVEGAPMLPILKSSAFPSAVSVAVSRSLARYVATPRLRESRPPSGVYRLDQLHKWARHHRFHLLPIRGLVEGIVSHKKRDTIVIRNGGHEFQSNHQAGTPNRLLKNPWRRHVWNDSQGRAGSSPARGTNLVMDGTASFWERRRAASVPYSGALSSGLTGSE
jgi:hypothetical protein